MKQISFHSEVLSAYSSVSISHPLPIINNFVENHFTAVRKKVETAYRNRVYAGQGKSGRKVSFSIRSGKIRECQGKSGKLAMVRGK